MRYSTLSEHSDNPGLSSADVLVIDCFGLLSSIYRYADVTYVGGGFGVGIHNTLEAAVWDVPVIFGPNNERFQEAQGLKACGGGFEIQGADGYAAAQPVFDEASFRNDLENTLLSKYGSLSADEAGSLSEMTANAMVSRFILSCPFSICLV